MTKFGEYRKAIYAFLGTVLFNLLLVMRPDSTLAEVTQYQWIVIIASVVGVPAVVSGVANDNFARIIRRTETTETKPVDPLTGQPFNEK